MNTSEEGRKIRSLIDCVNEACKTHAPKFKPKAMKVPVRTVLGVFADYDEIYEYTEQNVTLVTSDDIQHATYRFGVLDELGLFVVFYVGRADNGLQQRMKQHWEDFTKNDEFDCYKDRQIFFSIKPLISEIESYHRECTEYHKFDDGLHGEGAFLNKIHPAIPKGSNEHCPVCGEPE